MLLGQTSFHDSIYVPASNTPSPFVFALALVLPGQVMAQISQGKMPQQWNTSEPVSVEWMEFEALDMEQIAGKMRQPQNLKTHLGDLALSMKCCGMPRPTERGQRKGVRCVAIGRTGRFGHQLSFYFSTFDVPKGGELFVWNASREAFWEVYICQ